MNSRYLLIFFLVSQTAFAQSLSDRLLVKPEGQMGKQQPTAAPDKTMISPFESQNIATAPEKEAGPSDLSVYSVSASAGPNSQNYSLKGSGFNGNLSSEYGYEYGVKGSFHSQDESRQMFLNYDHSDVSYSGTSSLSPSDISVKRDYLFGGYSDQSFLNRRFGYKLGYGLLNQDATTTTPNSLISSYNSHGPLLGVGYRRPDIFGEWTMAAEGSLYLPFDINEEKSSGSRGFSYLGQFDASLSKALSPKLRVSVGFRARMDQQSYSGRSQSGTTDVKTSYQTFSIPIELRYSL